MIKYISGFWKANPYKSILILALFVRIIAAIFSQGYGMHDDHFLVVEASQAWVDGDDYDAWLPKNQVDKKPGGHSFFYVGIHYLLFTAFEFVGIYDPAFKMHLIRLLHALFSMLIVSYGYRITKLVSDEKSAIQVGLFLGLLWFMPFMSVHQMVEIVCIPFLMIGTYKLLLYERGKISISQLFLIGLITGIAFSVRFQSALLIGGMGLVLVIRKQWKETIIFGLGILGSIFLIQGIVDFFIWGYPFAELLGYVDYNINHRYDYIVASWYNYLLLLIGIIIFPVGLFLLFGYFYKWKQHLMIFLPSFIFLAFHSYFPNKQERFIFPMIPFFIIMGVIGWNSYREKSKFWKKRKSMLKAGMIFFWSINILALSVISTTYSKRVRVETMRYLSTKEDLSSILLEDTNRKSTVSLPIFYLGKWVNIYELSIDDKSRSAKYNINIGSLSYFDDFQKENLPEYIVFYGDRNLKSRVEAMQEYFPEMKFEEKIETGFIDRIMFKLNPTNKNEEAFVYKSFN